MSRKDTIAFDTRELLCVFETSTANFDVGYKKRVREKVCKCCKVNQRINNYFVQSKDKTKARNVCIYCWEKGVKKEDGTISPACGNSKYFSQIRGINRGDYTAESYQYPNLDFAM
tara:strand:+ start:224 stop:568 length:345 start_codon:yes stop_codon:yes gene_type:complete